MSFIQNTDTLIATMLFYTLFYSELHLAYEPSFCQTLWKSNVTLSSILLTDLSHVFMQASQL